VVFQRLSAGGKLERLPALAAELVRDANLLLYAYHPRAEQHETSRAWLEATLSGPGLVRFA
jgi:hypothetical protein